LRLLTQRHGAAAAFASAPRPARRTPWREARWCALDVELTGLDPTRDVIIAAGAVPIDEGRLSLGQSVYTLVRTSKRSEPDAVVLHKLRVADLEDAPSLEDAVDLILESLSGRVPVFHAAAVERTFLGPRFAERGVRLPAAADTEILGRLLLRERDSVAASRLPLGKLASMLSLPTGPAHHALGDALTTGAAFIALASNLDTVAPQTVGSLVHAEERLRGARRFG
jgi:DNA polymerase III subunit epsilon